MDEFYDEILKRTQLYTGTYLSVEQLSVRLPDGRTGTREIVNVRDAVAVFAIDDDEQVYLVRQHRPAIGKTLLEIPAGLIEPEENPEETAVRECEEEIGQRPGKLDRLLTYAHAEGYSTGWLTLYLGRNLVPSVSASPDETEYLRPVVLPFQDLMEEVLAGGIQDSKTILSSLIWSLSFKNGQKKDWLNRQFDI